MRVVALILAVLTSAYAVLRLILTMHWWHIMHCCRCSDRITSAIKTWHANGRCQSRSSHAHHGVELEP